MWEKVQQTVNYLQSQGISAPDFGIVLGTGLGNLASEIDAEVKIAYEEIPNFPVATVKGHHGELIYGKLGGKMVLAMRGRFHYYEGYTMEQVIFPIRVMKVLGVEKLLVSNASGGVNSDFKVGDIMLISDHINFMPEHPLRGLNDERFGPRFVDMHEPYDLELIQQLEEIAAILNIPVRKGVYLALQGPTFETPAEYRMVKLVGADTVGMSTVPEVITAKHMGMRCVGLSVITDLGVEGQIVEVSHAEVQEVARKAEKILSRLVTRFVELS